MSDSSVPCAASCAIDRARFLRTTAVAAFAGIAGVGSFAESAFAASVDTIAPTKSQGKVFTYALPAKDGALIDDPNGVIVARVGSTVYALSLICPHRAVTTLEWVADAKQFHCPKHDAHFKSDGELIDGRPRRAMDRFALKRDGGTIVVDTTTLLQQDTTPDAWAKASLTIA
jgi:nitrite reductase/ring-hydroxylating ferredoxin subunit